MITDKELDAAILAYQSGTLSVFDLISKCQMRDLHTQNLINQALALPEPARLKLGLDDMCTFSTPTEALPKREDDDLEDDKPKGKAKLAESPKAAMDQYLDRLTLAVGIRMNRTAKFQVGFDPNDNKMVVFKSKWEQSNILEEWFRTKGLKFESSPLNSERRRICITIYELKKVKLVPPQPKVINSSYTNIVADKIYPGDEEPELFGKLSITEWEGNHDFTFTDKLDFDSFKDYLNAVRVMPLQIHDLTVVVRTTSLRRLNLIPE